MANVILKNRNGEPVLHENRTSIKIPKQGGGEATFYESGGSSFWEQYLAGTLTEVTEDMLAGLTEIRRYLFDGQENLERVELPSTIERINAHAFSSCFKLSEINIPSGVNYIGDGAFTTTDMLNEFVHLTPSTYGGTIRSAGCFSLSGIKNVKIVLRNTGLLGRMFLWSAVKVADISFQSDSKIYDAAFNGAPLESLTLRSASVVTLDYDRTNPALDPFASTPNDFSIYVPSNLVNSYKAHSDWSSRANYIFPIPT